MYACTYIYIYTDKEEPFPECWERGMFRRYVSGYVSRCVSWYLSRRLFVIAVVVVVVVVAVVVVVVAAGVVVVVLVVVAVVVVIVVTAAVVVVLAWLWAAGLEGPDLSGG